jgi:hypothetical protein
MKSRTKCCQDDGEGLIFTVISRIECCQDDWEVRYSGNYPEQDVNNRGSDWDIGITDWQDILDIHNRMLLIGSN